MFGALWNNENVYLAVYNPNSAAVSITLGGIAINAGTAASQVVTAGKYVECGIPHGIIGSSVSGYGTQISATVQIGSDVWDGTIILSSTNWFRTATATRALSPAARGTSQSALVDMDGAPNGYQGSQKIFCGWNFYDNYNPSGTNPRAVRTYMTYQGTYLAPLADRTTDTVLEYTFQANEMPVYELGYDNEFWNYITTAGFTYWITDGSSKTSPNMASMGIVNTDIGLVFVAQDPNGYQSYPLHKYVGDTFRVGNVWQPDGDVVLYIDGVPVTVFKNVQILPMIEFSPPPTIITMNIMRSDKRTESTADKINVNITNMALCKACGINFPTMKEGLGVPISLPMVPPITFGIRRAKHMTMNRTVSTDGAKSWNGATLADIPMNGIEIRLDYPEGTSADTHDFKLIHMFSEDSLRHSVTAGDWESPEIIEKEDGLYVRMMGFSPVILAWDQPGDAPANSASAQFPIALYAAVPAVLVIGAAAAIVLAKRSSKKRSA